MDKTFDQMTTTEKMEALRKMTIEERMEALRPMFDAALTSARTASFGKAPKDGWNETDRVPQ